MILTNTIVKTIPIPSSANFVEVESFAIEQSNYDANGFNTEKIISKGKHLINMSMVSALTPYKLTANKIQLVTKTDAGHWIVDANTIRMPIDTREVYKVTYIHKDIAHPAFFITFTEQKNY